jgi:hypothetical protein
VAKRLYNLLIDPDLDAGLKAVKARDGINESEQVWRAIRKWLESKGVMKAERKRPGTGKRS